MVREPIPAGCSIAQPGGGGAGCRYKEAPKAVSALRLLWRRLRAEAERTAATPSERLLDDALQLLGAPHHSQLRQLEVPPPSPPPAPLHTHTHLHTAFALDRRAWNQGTRRSQDCRS